MPLIIGEIILDARTEHPAFTREKHSNRICVDYLSERHRVCYKAVADELKDRLSISRSVAAVIAGSLVGVDAAGAAYAVSSGADGYAVAVGADLVPYVVGPVISSDPFNDGFVLPSDSLQIIAIWATLKTAQQRIPVRWVNQAKDSQFGTGDGLVATVNGFRLKPIVNPTGVQSLWDSVESVTVAYVPEPAEFDSLAPATLALEISIPTVYGHVLKWELVAFLGRRESAINPDFPKALLSFYDGQVTQARSDATSGAILDHRIVKVHRTTRNR